MIGVILLRVVVCRCCCQIYNTGWNKYCIELFDFTKCF